MKKILALVLTLVMVLGLMGCSDKNESETHLTQDELIKFYVANEYGKDELLDSEYVYKVTNVAYDTEDPGNTLYTFVVGVDRIKNLEEDGEQIMINRSSLENYYNSENGNYLELFKDYI